MKTIFDQQTLDALVARLQTVSPASDRQWGRMSPYQMLKHCRLSDELFQGRKAYRRLFIGKLFGGMALKGLLRNEAPIKKNQPTHPEMKISGEGSFDDERSKWTALLNGYCNYSTSFLIHPFFGAMSREQIGACVYKHADHHLRQFGC